MIKLEKFENLKDGKVTKETVLKYTEDGIEKEAIIYDAFMDTENDKIYIVDARENAVNENGRLTVSLSTIQFEGDYYSLDGTSEEDYKATQLPLIQIKGSNYQEDMQIIDEHIKEKFGDKIVPVNLELINANIDKIRAYEKRPPRKVNIPVMIAEGIKKYYLNRLDKLLTKVYESDEMVKSQAKKTNKKLDKIDSKLDKLATKFEKFEQTEEIKQDLDEIQSARIDIEEAKNRIQNITVEEEQEYVPYSEYIQQHAEMNENLEVAENQPIENVEEGELELPPLEPIAEINQPLSVEQETVEPESELSQEEPIQVEQATNTSVETQNEVNEEEKNTEAINLIIGEVANDLSKKMDEIYSAAIQKISVDIKRIYDETRNNLMVQHGKETEELIQKLNETSKQLETEMEKNKNLTQENTNLKTANEQLQEDSKNAKLLDARMTEVKGYNSKLEKENETLKEEKQKLEEENKQLINYKQNYERIASMFGGQTVGQPVAPQSESLQTTHDEISEAVDYATAPYIEPEQSTKIL